MSPNHSADPAAACSLLVPPGSFSFLGVARIKLVISLVWGLLYPTKPLIRAPVLQLLSQAHRPYLGPCSVKTQPVPSLQKASLDLVKFSMRHPVGLHRLRCNSVMNAFGMDHCIEGLVCAASTPVLPDNLQFSDSEMVLF